MAEREKKRKRLQHVGSIVDFATTGRHILERQNEG